MEISAKCLSCGSAMFQIPDDDEADQMVRCASCGADVGDKQAVRDQLAAAGKKKMEEMLKKALKLR